MSSQIELISVMVNREVGPAITNGFVFKKRVPRLYFQKSLLHLLISSWFNARPPAEQFLQVMSQTLGEHPKPAIKVTTDSGGGKPAPEASETDGSRTPAAVQTQRKPSVGGCEAYREVIELKTA